MLLLVNTVKGQSINLNTVNQLSPNFVFDTLLNYKNEKVALADLKGKSVIIDFWSTGCLPCIKAFPMLEGFQKRFGDSLQILLTGSDLERTKYFYEARKKTNKPMVLPCAINRNAWNYFGIHEVSTFVWIDDKGYVKAITDDSQVTEKNVADFISKKEVQLHQVQNKVYEDYKKNLLTTACEIDSSSVVFNFTFTKYLPGIKSSSNFPPMDGGTKVRATNYAILGLYMIAFGDSTGNWPYPRISNETAHPEKYIPQRGIDVQEWKFDNTYCYQLTVPASRKKDLYKIMQDDLSRMFGMNVYFEDRVQKCLVLTAEKNAPLMADKSMTPKFVPSSGGITIINHSFARFFEALSHYWMDKIVLDETGITGNIAITLQVQMNDLDSLNAALKKYGLNLAYKDRTIRMMIFKDPVK